MFKNKKQYIEYVAILCIAVIITGWVLKDSESIKNFVLHFFSILSPFFIGFGIAYILEQPISKLESHIKGKNQKRKRSFIILGVYLFLIIAIVIVAVVLVPMVISNGMSLADDITQWSKTIPDRLNQLDFGNYESFLIDQLSKISEKISEITSSLLTNIVGIITGITTAIFNVVLGIIISIYMLLDKHRFAKMFKKVVALIFKEEKSKVIFHFVHEANTVFSHFLTGLLVQAFILAILATIGFTILGVKYAIVLGLIIGMTNIIPYFGPFIGSIPAVLTTLMYDPIKAIWVIVLIIILQQIDGNVVGPRVMGNYIGLAPIWIILSITLGGGLFGLLGMLLAIPIGAIIKIMLTEMIKTRENIQASSDVNAEETKL